MKITIKPLFIGLMGLLCFTACEDLFQTNPDDIINVDDYINDDEEMYKGYMGILTKMQQAADHSIYLTDTRSDFLEVTANAPLELQQVYNYEHTDGNSFADPAPFYAVVVACNDFMDKMRQYREKVGENMDEKNAANFKSLVSMSLRFKVWAYLKLGSIYGEAVWFDDPLEKKESLGDTTVFAYCKMPQIVERCLNLLDNGVTLYKEEVIPATLSMDWAAWFNEETTSTEYVHWEFMVPNWMLLRCELLSWRGTQADWLWIRDNILTFLYKVHNMGTADFTNTYHASPSYPGFYCACNIPIQVGGNGAEDFEYYKIFYNELYNSSNRTNFFQVICGVMYDYENQQRNNIVEYFCPQAPVGKYYLRPSTYAMAKYNPNDIRGVNQQITMNVISGDTAFTKYYYYRGEYLRQNIVEIDPVIPLQRGHDYHFLLAEAENHLGNWHQSEVILNKGVTNEFASKTLPTYWNKNYYSWFCDNGGYGDIGIAGAALGSVHQLPTPKDVDYSLSEQERQKVYDLAILDEALQEYTGEGKSYAYLCQMAERYNDPSLVADRICPKYPEARRAQVRAAIEAGGYWVKWDLKIDDLLSVSKEK